MNFRPKLSNSVVAVVGTVASGPEEDEDENILEGDDQACVARGGGADGKCQSTCSDRELLKL